jgi:hypothetical protein
MRVDGQTIKDITSAGYLKEIVFLEFLENTPFNFNELIGHQKGEKSVIIGVYGNIERN